MNRLPNEILGEIVSYLPQETWSLVNYATTNKSFWHIISSLLYKSVKLRETGSTAEQFKASTGIKNRWDYEPVERQRLLLETIARNAKIGSLVQEFSNDRTDDWTTLPQADAQVLIQAASNLSRILNLRICYNPLAIQAITLPPWTATLSNLIVDYFSIEDFIWPPDTSTRIRCISWTTPRLYDNDGRSTAQSFHKRLLPNMIKIFASTCPYVEKLDLQSTDTMCRTRYHCTDWDFEKLGIDTGNYKKYDFTTPAPKMRHLKHFGLQRWMYMEDESDIGLEIYRGNITELSEKAPETSEDFMIEFAKAYKDQLRSLTWDLANYPQNVTFLEIILPELANLTKFQVSGVKDTPEHKDMLGRILTMVAERSGDSLQELGITGPDGHDILPGSGPTFSQEYGALLASTMGFSNLTHLNISTWVTDDCKQGGYLELDKYSKRFLRWIKQLPPGLIALDIIIGMEDISLDVIEDDIPYLWIEFAQAFVQANMTSLNRCDIAINYSGREGSSDTETLVFRRRDAQTQSSVEDACGTEVERILWVWWIGSEYQHNGHQIVRDCSRIKIHPFQGTEFEGKSAPLWVPDPGDLAVLHYRCEECDEAVRKAENYETWQEQSLDPGDLYDSDDLDSGSD